MDNKFEKIKELVLKITKLDNMITSIELTLKNGKLSIQNNIGWLLFEETEWSASFMRSMLSRNKDLREQYRVELESLMNVTRKSNGTARKMAKS